MHRSCFFRRTQKPPEPHSVRSPPLLTQHPRSGAAAFSAVSPADTGLEDEDKDREEKAVSLSAPPPPPPRGRVQFLSNSDHVTFLQAEVSAGRWRLSGGRSQSHGCPASWLGVRRAWRGWGRGQGGAGWTRRSPGAGTAPCTFKRHVSRLAKQHVQADGHTCARW